MAKGLVIVESPAKAKTIQKYLGKGYTVEASLGHVKDLPKSTLGVDIDNDFDTEYIVIPGKEKVVAKLKKLAGGVDTIYLAPDPDREGEAIAAHLAEELGDGAKTKKKKKKEENGHERFRRVTFNEITQRERAALAARGGLRDGATIWSVTLHGLTQHLTFVDGTLHVVSQQGGYRRLRFA